MAMPQSSQRREHAGLKDYSLDLFNPNNHPCQVHSSHQTHHMMTSGSVTFVALSLVRQMTLKSTMIGQPALVVSTGIMKRVPKRTACLMTICSLPADIVLSDLEMLHFKYRLVRLIGLFAYAIRV